jgi:hypothetical protein
MTDLQFPALADLKFLPYLTPEGTVPDTWAGQVGVYAIFDESQVLQYVGYSRDVSLSLTQHLIRRSPFCHWVKVHTIARPSRTALDTIRAAWIAEYGDCPPGNGDEEPRWTQPIDAKLQMTEAEKATYTAQDELGKTKTLKQVARRVEAQVLEELQQRGVTMALRFDPKLKETGLLNLKP